MNEILKIIGALFQTLSNAPKLVNQTLGALTAVSSSWSSVNVIGPAISTMIASILFFLIFDIVRDLL